MIIVDAHCDTITRIMELNEDLYKNNCHIDIHRMKKYKNYVQVFAAYIDAAYPNKSLRAVEIIDEFYQQIDIYKDDIMLCCNYKDVESAFNENKIAAILSIEGGEALQGDLSALRMFYKLGVRSICLTWNHRNEIANGVADASKDSGLTPFGREVVREMNSLGMIIDVSHISEKGFWDVIELSESPIIASHSNTKKICDHRRNLSDEQIQALKNNGGVMGINLYPWFLNNSENASISDILNHIEHVVALTGYDHIGLGADFDGIESVPKEVSGVQDIELIFNELLKLNYPEQFINKLAGENFLRVIKEIMP